MLSKLENNCLTFTFTTPNNEAPLSFKILKYSIMETRMEM